MTTAIGTGVDAPLAIALGGYNREQRSYPPTSILSTKGLWVSNITRRSRGCEICSEVVDLRFLEARGVPSQRVNWKSRGANVAGRVHRTMHGVHQDEKAREELMLDLDEIASRGARKMLAEALEAEVDTYIEAATDQRDERGHALVVRNDYAREREILCGAGAVEVKAPRVNDRRVDNAENTKRFKSVIVSPYMCRSPKVTEVLPLVYLHSLSSGDFVAALEEFFGTGAGLSAATITWLTERWQAERESFMRRDLSRRDYVYVWVKLGGDERICYLVMVGARLDGAKDLVVIQDGYGESEVSWAELLRDLKKRSMRARELAVGDGALGFWGAVRDVFPETRYQRDWIHKTMNVLDSCPRASTVGQRVPSRRSPAHHQPDRIHLRSREGET
jgi:hypothetical protein